MAARVRQAVALLVVAHIIAIANAASLDILPSGDVQTKPIGSSTILTCKPDVDELKLVSDMQWFDPQNQPIETLNTRMHSKPPMYTEFHEDSRTLSLIINSLQEEQAGKYTCKANYANTEQLSKTISIETIVAITFENAPVNQYPILGEDFSVVCKVRASPSPSVDWLYNDELIKTNDHYIIETHALKIKNVQESDDGVYTCRASVLITGELQVRPIRVEVHTRPKIEEFLSPIEIVEGDNANIACKASGKPLPKYTWVKSITQQNLSNADRFGVDADTGVLTITNVNRDDAGEYQCRATNAAGTATSDIRVEVIVKPKIMEFLNNTVAQGREASIVCKAFGRPPPKVTFRKYVDDSKPYILGAQPEDDRIVLTNSPNDSNGETIANLTIRNSLRYNDGLYECIAENKGGRAVKNGHLIVEFPPSFAAMRNNTVWSWEQRPVNLTCIAEAIPNATIRWTVRGDQRIDHDPMIKQIGTVSTSILMITPLDNRYYTNYKCIATNPHGTREHDIILEEAKRPADIVQAKMSEITATTIAFHIVPPPTHPDLPVKSITVQYRKENQPWSNAKNRTWSINSRYVLENLEPQTLYDFRFAAMNDVGLGNWIYHHEMTPGRTFPNEPKVIKSENEYEVSLYSNQYQLQWVAPPDNGEPIDLYQIKYCQAMKVSGEWKTLSSTCITEDIRTQGRTHHYFKNLRSDTFYRAEVTAHNVMGYSKSGFVIFKTAKGDSASVLQHHGKIIPSSVIIGLVISIVIVIFVVTDVICCCANKTGLLYYACERSRRKPVDEEDTKLGRDEKEPLKEERKITPIIDSGLRRETSITFDGKRSISKTGFVGKDSAV